MSLRLASLSLKISQNALMYLKCPSDTDTFISKWNSIKNMIEFYVSVNLHTVLDEYM